MVGRVRGGSGMDRSMVVPACQMTGNSYLAGGSVFSKPCFMNALWFLGDDESGCQPFAL